MSQTMSREARGFVGLYESRFPLNLVPENPKLQRMWSLAKASTWDPEVDIDYASFDHSKYSKEQLEAAALFWSRRAWAEYTGIAESPVVLVRMALDGWRHPEGKYLLASKMMDEAKHIEASYLLAEAIGGYTAQPEDIGVPNQSLVAGLRDRGLDSALSFEAVVAAWHCVSETIAVRVFKTRYGTITEPVVKDVLGRIIKDEARHIDFGWYYLEQVLSPDSDEEVRDNVRTAMIDVIENVELGGFHAASAAEGNPLTEIDAIVAEAGLGAADPATEQAAVYQGLAEIRTRAKAWGVDLPDYAPASKA